MMTANKRNAPETAEIAKKKQKLSFEGLDAVCTEFRVACEKETEREGVSQRYKQARRELLCQVVEALPSLKLEVSLYDQLEACSSLNPCMSALAFADHVLDYINDERFECVASDKHTLILLDANTRTTTQVALPYLSEIASDLHVVDSRCDLQHILAMHFKTLPPCDAIVRLWTCNFSKFANGDPTSLVEYNQMCSELLSLEGWNALGNAVLDFIKILEILALEASFRTFK